MGGVRTLPRTTLQAHSDGGFGLRGVRLYQSWMTGPSEGSPGPHLLSVNEYRPHRLSDVVPIARVSAELVRQVIKIEDAVGIATSYQPLGRITYSLSIWKSEEALRAFTISSLHRKVMAEYRSRGYLRHIHWWGEHTTIGAGMAEATHRLDGGEGRRVGDPRDGWARRDQRLLAEVAVEGRRNSSAILRGSPLRSPHRSPSSWRRTCSTASFATSGSTLSLSATATAARAPPGSSSWRGSWSASWERSASTTPRSMTTAM
jgi:hypothetical protein